MKIKILKAFNGDSFLLSFDDSEGNSHNILIDGGISKTYKIEKNSKGKTEYGELKYVIDDLRAKNQHIDLLILTHIDDDHIGGILKWFNDDVDAYKLIKEVWFNSGKIISEFLMQEANKDLDHYINPSKSNNTSLKQGIEFGRYLSDKGIWKHKVILQGETMFRFGLEFKILSPNKSKLEQLLKEWKKKDPSLQTSSKRDDYADTLRTHIENDIYEPDSAPVNGSSIAFILVHKDFNLLFLGDSHSEVIIEGLDMFNYSEQTPLKAKYVKVAHHGSQGNTSSDLLKCIASENYIISTNGKGHEHPHKQLISRIINHNEICNIYFNYEERIKKLFNEKDFIAYPSFKAIAITNELYIV